MPDPSPRAISALGDRFISAHELPGGVVKIRHLHPYDDGAGILTIGKGHRIHAGEDFSAGLTFAEVEALYQADTAWVEARLNTLIDEHAIDLIQPRYDALADFLFNTGWSEFVGSSIYAAFLGSRTDSPYVPSAMVTWTKGGGRRLDALVLRRLACAWLWLSEAHEYRPYMRVVLT